MSKKGGNIPMGKDKITQYKFIDIAKNIKNSEYADETLIDKVLLSNSQYKIFFGKTFNEEKYRPWKRGIIKIANTVSNVSILRMYMGASKLGIDDSHFFVPKLSQNMLAINKAEQKYSLKKGSKFWFYWQHPSHSVRASFKATFVLGIISIILGIIGLIH